MGILEFVFGIIGGIFEFIFGLIGAVFGLIFGLLGGIFKLGCAAIFLLLLFPLIIFLILLL